jgi:hypothetical protein
VVKVSVTSFGENTDAACSLNGGFMQLNAKAVNDRRTNGGAVASSINAEQELRRTVMACMLWESNFYESGESVVDRIRNLIPKCRPEFAAACAYEARTKMKLRHAPLLIVREMARHPEHKCLVKDLLRDVIQRADELSEFMALYWQDGKQPISAQVKKGLAAAFRKFDEHQLAKYNRDNAIKLRDVLFLCHSKPVDAQGSTKTTRKALREGIAPAYVLNSGEELYRKLVDGELTTPDTWEVALSGGADKKETFERLMAEKQLGALAFIRNMRGMKEAGVSKDAVRQYAGVVNIERVLPFRFLSAARAVPGWEDVIEPMMLRCLEGQEKLNGKTVLVLDTSGSMHQNISSKSDLTRLQTAAALAVLAREVCDDVSIYCTAGNDWDRIHATMEIPVRRGFALSDYISSDEVNRKIGGGGIFLKQCLDYIEAAEKGSSLNWTEPERVIVLTDEQDCDLKLSPNSASAFGRHNYIINVASYQNGIAYNKFTHINGWSESVIDFIREFEKDGQ